MGQFETGACELKLDVELAPLFSSCLDPGIEPAVLILRDGGIATVESCEGGPGHCFPEPTVRFEGSSAEAWRALAVVLDHGLPVLYLRRQWTIASGDPEGPYWELVFRPMISRDASSSVQLSK